MKSIFKSKTVWLACLQGASGVLVAIISADSNVSNIGLILIIKSAIDIVLRMYTTKSIE